MDGADWAKVITALTGLMAVMTGFARWVISYYFKRAERMENLRRELVVIQINALKDAVHEVKLNAQTIVTKLAEHDSRFAVMMEKIQSNATAASAVLQYMKEFVAETKQRFESIEQGTLVKIGQDTYIIKGKAKDGRTKP